MQKKIKLTDRERNEVNSHIFQLHQATSRLNLLWKSKNLTQAQFDHYLDQVETSFRNLLKWTTPF